MTTMINVLIIFLSFLYLQGCTVDGYGADNAFSTRNTALKRLKDSCLLPAHLRSVECCFDDSDWTELGETGRNASSRCEFDEATQSFPCAIRLGMNNWDASFATTYVAKIFIEEYLGWPVEIRAESTGDGVVATQDIFDPLTGELQIEGQWELMHTGLLDAMLEIWPSGHEANELKYVKQLGTVINAGLLGVVGKIGWYFPSFLLESEEHGIVGPSENIEFWRSLIQNPHVFKDPAVNRPCCPLETGPFLNTSRICMAPELKGGTPVEQGGLEDFGDCDSEPDKLIPTGPGGRFLNGADSWSTLDRFIIKNLGLNFTVEFAQTEQNLIDEMTKMVESSQPLLMYFWKPHGIFRKLNLSSILLPHFELSCFDNGFEGFACDYPSDVLYKAYATRVRDTKPDLASFLDFFSFKSGNDQEVLMADFLFGDNSNDWNKVTCDWLKRDIRRQEGPNSRFAEWKAFIDAQFSNKVWQDDAPKPVRAICDCNENNERNIVEYYTMDSPLVGVTFEVDTEFCSEGSSAGTYSTRWTNQEYPSTIIESISCNYIRVESNHAKIIIGCIGFSSFVILMLAFSVVYYRETQIMRASSRRTMAVFLSGALFLNFAALTSIGYAPSVTSCFLHIFFLAFGASWLVGSLLLKEFYLYRLFYPLVITSRNTLRTKILYHQLIISSILPTLVVLLWAVIPGFHPQEEKILLSSGVETDAVQGVCPSDGLLTGAVALIYILGILLCCAMSYYTRKIPGLFSEARYVALSSYNILVFLAAIGIVTSSISLTFMEQELITALALSWVTLVSAMMVVGTRTYVAVQGLSFDLHFDIDKRTGSFGCKARLVTNKSSGTSGIQSQNSYRLANNSKFKVNLDTNQSNPTTLSKT